MKTLFNSILLTLNPKSGWSRIAENPTGMMQTHISQTIPLAFIPAVCWYAGVTQVGWAVMGDPIKLTPESALPMCILFYVAMVAGVIFLGSMAGWMATTYNAGERAFDRGVTLISHTATPFFLAGFLGVYPVLWLDIVIGTAVACFCIYLLFQGTGTIMQVPPERAFLYAAALFAVALVAFVALLGATVIIWDLGATPEYTY